MTKNNIETENYDGNNLWKEVANSDSVVKDLVRSLLQAEKKLLETEIKEKKEKAGHESLKARVTWIDQYCHDFLFC